MKNFVLALLCAASAAVWAEEWCIDGVCYLTKEAYEEALAAKNAAQGWQIAPAPAAQAAEELEDEDGEEEEEDEAPAPAPASVAAPVAAPVPVPAPVAAPGPRVLLGKRDSAGFIAFLNGEDAAPASGGGASSIPGWAESGFLALLFFAFLCGLGDNLTPCVYPLIPVNIAIIGRSWQRGLVYGIGQITGAGALGLVAALAGAAFGAVQQNVWFNVVATVAMVVLGIAMLDVIHIDLSRFRKTAPRKRGEKPKQKSIFAVWGLGAASVLLAGACVEPVLLALLFKTADGVGSGALYYAALPFAFGAGLALPWPFIGAGLGALPKPGVWMVWFKRVLAVVVFAFAAWYGSIAYRLATAGKPDGQTAQAVQPAAGAKPRLWMISAPWCLNCHEMHRTVLKEPEVLKAMEKFDVREIEINTLDDLKAYPELQGLSIPGLPCYVIMEGGL